MSSHLIGIPWPLKSREVITQRASPAIFEIMGPTYCGHELDLTGSQDLIDHMTIHMVT